MTAKGVRRAHALFYSIGKIRRERFGSMMNYRKYRGSPVVDYPEREWPGKQIKKAPVWCSVDLRDGNQALTDPMTVEEKLEMFQYLVKLGFREIEVGFPAASQIEFDFLRRLIREELIPDGVYVQVLSQCREEQIERTFEALEICTAVQRTWGASKEDPVILNLPSTVECSTPNVYADQIEWMNRHFEDRESIILSIHPHNDRGTGVGSAELALLAGAERVEGTLFGNGERTGNVDLLNIAYNMFSQGIDPELELGHINDIIRMYEKCCKMPVHPRHPYAGKLVFTAFSGSHQDAINKGLHAMKERKSKVWQVPYLPIDPADIGREYEPIVRINSQSGKGGVAFIMETYFGFKLPKAMHREFADVIQKLSEKQGEVAPQEIMEHFRREYLDQKRPLHFLRLKVEDLGEDTAGEFDTKVTVAYAMAGTPGEFAAVGNGPIDAVKRGLREQFHINIRVLDYEEHALQNGSNAEAAAYIHVMDAESGRVTYGADVSSNITRASVRAMFSAVNRLELVRGA